LNNWSIGIKKTAISAFTKGGLKGGVKTSVTGRSKCGFSGGCGSLAGFTAGVKIILIRLM